MRATRSAPPAVHDPVIAEIARRPGPFLTVYLTTEAEVPNAAQRTELRWRDLRRDLTRAGAPEPLLAEVDPLVGSAHLNGRCLTVVGTEGHPLFVEHQLDEPVADLASWSALPVLAPVVEWREQWVPHLVVLVDRTGADVLVYSRTGADRAVEAKGTEEGVHKSPVGGWSQRRFQQRVENAWEENAGDVADAVAREAARAGAELIVVAGDVRAVALLRKHLPKELAPLVHVVDGGRASDGSEDEVAAETSTWVATVSATHTRAALEELHQGLGRGDTAVSGADAVIEALNESRVETLLIPGDVGEGPMAWFGPDPTPVSETPDDLESLGISEPVEAPLTDVLIRAALGTDAGIRVVPTAALKGAEAAALLRW